MNRKYAIFALAIIMSLLLTSCAAKQGTFRLHSPDALSTTASPSVVAQAIREMHDALGHHYEQKPDGSRSDPSFKQGSRWWNSGKSQMKATVELTRSTTEFRDGKGRLVMVEIIRAKEKPALVFFTYEGANGAIPVINAFTASLQKQGFKPVQ